MVKYTHIKEPIIADQLEDEIRSSSITIALDYISSSGPQVDVHFKDTLSAGEQGVLGVTVSGHVPDLNALNESVVITSTLDKDGNVVPDVESPVTEDGEVHTIQSNMANITGNKLVNWSMTYTLGAATSIDERFVVPAGQTASIEFIQGYSSAVPFSVELNWYRGEGNRINPAIDPKDYPIQSVDGAHSGGDTVITLKPGGHGFAFNAIEANKRYAFLTSSGTTFVREVLSRHIPSKTVTLGAGIPSDLSNGDKFTLVDRPIARLGGNSANALMDFEVAPSFRGDGTRYLELVIKNESLTDSGDVFAVVNGWTTSTVSGTIPGSGGDAGVDEDA